MQTGTYTNRIQPSSINLSLPFLLQTFKIVIVININYYLTNYNIPYVPKFYWNYFHKYHLLTAKLKMTTCYCLLKYGYTVGHCFLLQSLDHHDTMQPGSPWISLISVSLRSSPSNKIINMKHKMLVFPRVQSLPTAHPTPYFPKEAI